MEKYCGILKVLCIQIKVLLQLHLTQLQNNLHLLQQDI